MINNISDNKIIEAFDTLIPILPNFFKHEVIFTISNTEKFLRVVNSKHIKLNAKRGDLLPPTCCAAHCIKNKDITSVMVPEKTFGVALETIGIPIKDEENNVIGSIVLGRRSFKNDLLDVSHKLTNSMVPLTEISTKTSKNIQKFVDVNTEILNKIDGTKKHAKQTDEILNIIKQIASNANLLGFNASIQAANAGEAGKAFEVVAKEIRNLSTSSRSSIVKINTILEYMKQSIEEISESVLNSNMAIQHEFSNIQEITSTITELSATAKKLEELSNLIS